MAKDKDSTSTDPEEGTRLAFAVAAGIGSVLFAGLGHVIIGKFFRGILAAIAAFVLWFFLLGWIVHLWAIYDAATRGYRGDVLWLELESG